MSGKDELEAEYDEEEAGVYWPKKPRSSFGVTQYFRIWDAMHSSIRQTCLEENLDSRKYITRLEYAREILDELHDARTWSWNRASDLDEDLDEDERQKREQTIWFRRPTYVLDFAYDNDDKMDLVPDADNVEFAAARYLQRPWLRNDHFEWIVVDSLIYAEIDAYRREIRMGSAFGDIDLAYALGGSSYGRQVFYRLGIELSKLFALYFAPLILAAGFWWKDNEQGMLLALGWFMLVVVWRLASWPQRWRARRDKKKKLDEVEQRYLKMGLCYGRNAPPIVNPTLFQSQLRDAVASGVMFKAVVHTLVDMWAVRDPYVFVTEPDKTLKD